MTQRIPELIGMRHAHPLYAEATRHRCEVRAVRDALGSRVETGADLATAEHAVLDVSDCRPGEVVPHQPNRRDVVLHRGREHVRRHGETAVADDRETRALRRGELGAEDTADAE